MKKFTIAALLGLAGAVKVRQEAEDPLEVVNLAKMGDPAYRIFRQVGVLD